MVDHWLGRSSVRRRNADKQRKEDVAANNESRNNKKNREPKNTNRGAAGNYARQKKRRRERGRQREKGIERRREGEPDIPARIPAIWQPPKNDTQLATRSHHASCQLQPQSLFFSLASSPASTALLSKSFTEIPCLWVLYYNKTTTTTRTTMRSVSLRLHLEIWYNLRPY